MPHFRLETTVSADNISSDLPRKICEVISATLTTPFHYCVATVVPGVNISWAGTNEPCAQATLMSVGNMDPERNREHSKVLFELICQELQISPERMYIHYTDAQSSYVGYNYSTLQDIMG